MEQRWQLIRRTQIDYDDFYKFSGAIILVLMGIWLGMHFVKDSEGYFTNLYTEGLSIILTVLVIERLNRNRATQERKLALFRQAKSRLNDVAVEALDQIQHAGWWDNLLLHYYTKQKIFRSIRTVKGKHQVFYRGEKVYSNLSKVQWSGGVNLNDTNLKGVNFVDANLENANLAKANLEGADLRNANLINANLAHANLLDANLALANLKGVFLGGANLKGTDLWEVDFDKMTVLPDADFVGLDHFKRDIYDKYWTPETDMSRYTNPNHKDKDGNPDFWQPDWVKKQNE